MHCLPVRDEPNHWSVRVAHQLLPPVGVVHQHRVHQPADVGLDSLEPLVEDGAAVVVEGLTNRSQVGDLQKRSASRKELIAFL